VFLVSTDRSYLQPWAFESRDFLRAMAVGKEISFTSTHSFPSNDDVTRDFGTAEIGGVDVASEMLKNGWAKVKESKRDPTEDDIRKRDIEAEAKAAGKGLWNSHGPQVRVLGYHTIVVASVISVGPCCAPNNAN
jgi:staphylococcal nuclease domain-containing protein 1